MVVAIRDTMDIMVQDIKDLIIIFPVHEPIFNVNLKDRNSMNREEKYKITYVISNGILSFIQFI